MDERLTRPPGGAREVRTFAVGQLESRQDGDTLTLHGYASVFDHPYEMYGGPPYGWTESVAPGAFSKTLREQADVQLLVNHDGTPLARTKSKTLRLSEDGVGLKVEADLNLADPDVQRLAPKMARGDLDEMSMAFRTVKHEWANDDTERTLIELSLDKGDVSVVNFGANDATSTWLRHLEVLAGADTRQLAAELRAHTPLLAHVRAALDLAAGPDDDEPAAGDLSAGISLALARRIAS